MKKCRNCGLDLVSSIIYIIHNGKSGNNLLKEIKFIFCSVKLKRSIILFDKLSDIPWYIQGESKTSVIYSGVWCKIVPFFVQLSCTVFFQSFFELFFWYSNGPKKSPRTFFSLKIKTSEKRKCKFILFLSNSKIL